MEPTITIRKPYGHDTTEIFKLSDITGCQDSDIYATSDQHFWHSNVIKYADRRIFASPEEFAIGKFHPETVERMNETMIRLYNEIVKPQDLVFFVGDFALAFRSVELYGYRLNGFKILIWGNHDNCHPVMEKKQKGKRYRTPGDYKKHGFHDVCSEASMDIMLKGAKTHVLLNHFPYQPRVKPKDYTLRYMDFRPINKGELLLHGHVHTHWKKMHNQINIGVDQWDYKPVSIKQIEEILDQEIIQDPEKAKLPHGED